VNLVEKKVGEDKLTRLFITTDPDRDTADTLKKYIREFSLKIKDNIDGHSILMFPGEKTALTKAVVALKWPQNFQNLLRKRAPSVDSTKIIPNFKSL